MKAIIPVAGIGTRLRPHTHSAPKVLLPVAGKPMISHILDELVSIGVDEVTFIIGYKGDLIRDYVTSHYDFKSNFVEQPEMKGLGHAISLAKPHHNRSGEPVLIVLGDTIFKADLQSVFKSEVSSIGVREVEDGRRFGIVELNEQGEVRKLIEKPENPPTNLALVGIYYMKNPPVLFECLDELITEGTRTRGEFQLTDALQKMLDRGERMSVFKIEGWYDCGKAEMMLLTNRDLLEMQHSAERDKKLRDRFQGSVVHLPVAIADSVKIENCIVGPYVSISGGSVLTDCIVRNSIIGENSEVRSVVMEDSIISDNAKVAGNLFRLNVGDSSEIELD